jgi:DnaJ domain
LNICEGSELEHWRRVLSSPCRCLLAAQARAERVLHWGIDMTPSEALTILGLPEAADEAVIKEAYRRLSLETYPDRQGGDTQEQAQINDANDVAMSMISYAHSMTLHTSQSLRRRQSSAVVLGVV